MKWTREQLEAINKRGSNILVSAGAGSGKTAVLSERVLEYVKASNSVKDLLVLTFTNAAAREMKERIYKKLKENGLEEEANYTLNSDITTFDAYALSLVKKYAHLLGVDKNIGICDSILVKKEKEAFINDLFSKYYEEKNETFFKFLIHQNYKDDTSLIKGIIDLSFSLDLLSDPINYLNNYVNNYYSDNHILKVVDNYEKLILDKTKELYNKAIDVKELIDDDNVNFYNDLDSFIANLGLIKRYEDLKEYLENFKFSSLKRGSEQGLKDAKNNLTSAINDFKSLLSFEDKKAIASSLYASKSDVMFIVEVSKLVYLNNMNFKKKYGYFTFADIAKMAISLVKNFKEVRDDLAHYKEILVDEYQDTSDLQEEFLSYISKDKLYMVGDIKQSIYRFRNANPYIFKEKYLKYSKKNEGIKIDLLENFRSRKEVLENINLIFNNLMTLDVGDCDYINNGQMRYGLKSYDEYQDKDYDMEILSYDNEDSSFTNEEIEIFTCAKIVKDIIANKFVFAGDKLVKASYKDIAIIIDKSKYFQTFKKIFEYLGIPLIIERDEDVKENSFTMTLISLLNVLKEIKNKTYLDNKNNCFKRNLVSVLRSFIYEYSDEEIYNIIKNNNYDIELINDLKTLDFNLDSYNLFYETINKIKLYESLTKIGNMKANLTIIDYVANTLLNYNKLGYDFDKSVELLANIAISDEKMPYANNDVNNNEVRLMTIHKSKGLEFAYCIFPFLNSKPNDQDKKKDFRLNLDYGIYMKKAVNDDDSYTDDKSVISLLVNDEENRADISEKVRLLYVAITRAKEKFYLILDNKEIKNNKLITFKEMLESTNVINKYKKEINIENLNLTTAYNETKELTNINNNEGIKLTYNDINYHSEILNKGTISKTTNEIISSKTRKILELGTNIHEALASIDLKKPNYNLVKEEYRKYIKNVLELPLFEDIKDANIYQEQEFYYSLDNKSYHGIMDLVLEYSDHIKLIDYKFANLDKEEYIEQLNVYYNYLKLITNKKINVYLVGVTNLEVKELRHEF